MLAEMSHDARVEDAAKVVPPGSTIGILGDGQLGRMIALAAIRLGYKIAVLGRDGRASPAGEIAQWAAQWAEHTAVSEKLLNDFCQRVDVVLIEWENVPVDLVRRIKERGVPVRPDDSELEVAQDRLLEKETARRLGIPTPKFFKVGNADDLHFDWPGILKTRCDGYDGKGQYRVDASGSIENAWVRLGRVPCIYEELVGFKRELSVIIARRPDFNSTSGDVTVFGPFENVHENGILRKTVYPYSGCSLTGTLSPVAKTAITYAERLVEEFNTHGILAVEFFETNNGEVLFNEMAPRPHNSGHLTIDCCDTSQFEAYVLAACNLPLSPVWFRCGGKMTNIIGNEVDDWMRHVTDEHSKLHLYGKEPKPGRKVGHVTQLLFY